MSCVKRLFLGLFSPVFAFAALIAFTPSEVLADIAFDGIYSPDSASWSADADGYIGTSGTTAGTGTLGITSGTLSSKRGYLGYLSGSSGTATITGTDSTWNSGGYLYVGDGGTGTLNIQNGGTVTAYPVGSYIGNITIGDNSGSSGSVTVTGNDSKMTCPFGYLTVGYRGNGTLRIEDGGEVVGEDGRIGYNTGSSSTVTVTGADSTLTVNDNFNIGTRGTGQLYVQNGGSVSTGYGNIGNSSGGAGTVTVDGAGSTWTNATSLVVGRDGTATLNISNGGLVATSTDTYVSLGTSNAGTVAFGAGGGTLTTRSLFATPSHLTGAGTISTKGLVSDSALLFDSSDDLDQMVSGFGTVAVKLDMTGDTADVGFLGIGYKGTTGTLMICNGVTVNSKAGHMGYLVNSSGTATVDGAGSMWWNNESLFVGGEGAARLEITNGGGVNNTDGNIAFESSSISTATVDGSGSTWSNSDNLYVGRYGFGTLEVTNGGAVSSTDSYLGYDSGSKGLATVDGSGSTWTNSGSLYVGYGSDGDLDITGGGSVTVDGATYVGYSVGNQRTIHFSTGTLTTKSLYASPSSTYSALTGTGTINTHGLVSDANLTIDSPAMNTFTINDHVTVNLDVSDSNDVGDLGVGYWGNTGSLTIKNGVTAYSANGCLGYGTGSTGTANVDGATWNLAGNLYVGGDGTGTLNLTNGATVNSTGNTIITLGKGTLNFGAGGGTLTTKSLYSPLTTLAGTGTINTNGLVSDANITFDNAATAMFTNGGVTVYLDMSNPSNVGDLGVGYNTAAAMTIQNGAVVHSANGYLGYGTGSSGTATVTGSGSTWAVAGAFDLGFIGNGTLNINDSGTVAVSQINGGLGIFGDGGFPTLNMNGGILKATADAPTFINGPVAISVQDNGAQFDTNGHDVAIGPSIYDITLATLQHGGSNPIDGGVTKLGDGTLTIYGDGCPDYGVQPNSYTGVTTVKAGTLELADTGAQNSVLNVGGADIQGGKMVFDYTSSAPDIQTALTASYTGGTAAWTTGQFLSTTADGSYGLGWSDNGTDKVTVMYTLYGDSNLDGSVNGTDLNAVLSYYNQSSQVWTNGDFNYDGSVNGTDLNTVLSNYNQSLSSSTAAVPEPSTILLMVLGIAGLLAWRKRK